MSNEQESPIRAIVSNDLEATKYWSSSTSDDESYCDDYDRGSSINHTPSDEDVEASSHWTLSRPLGQGLWKTTPISKEETKKWKDSKKMWNAGKRKWCKRVEKRDQPLEGWNKWAHENPHKCNIRLR